MGELSEDSTLLVTAYDTAGNAWDSWAGIVHVVPFPAWLGSPDGDDYFSRGHYHLNGFFPELLQLTHTIPVDWWIIGAKQSKFRLGVDLGLVASLDARNDVPIDHEFVFELKVLGYPIFGFGYDPLKFALGDGVSMQFCGLAEGEDLSLAGLSGSLLVNDWSPLPGGSYSLPEMSKTILVPVGPVPIPVTLAVGLNLSMELDARLNVGLNLADRTVKILPGTFVEPSVSAEPYIFGGLGIGWLNIGLEAGGELGLRYRAEYDSAGGYSDYSWGTFQINLRAVATAGKKHTLATWTVPSGSPWTFGNVPPGAITAIWAADDSLALLPWPNVTADAAGNVLLARVVDGDPAAEQIDPEIAYALRDPGGTWSVLNPVASNGLIESDPDAAFDGLGGAVVAWVANTIDPALVETTQWETYLETQEIHSSYWDGTTWSAPQSVTSDVQMDGGPEVAFHDGQGLMLWEHAAGVGGMDLDGFEIEYALWDDTAHVWGAPIALTDDEEGDWAPAVASGPNGQATAVWVHDADSDPTTAALRYATWDGAAWSAAAGVPVSSTDGVAEPRIAYTSSGDVLLAWIGNEGGPDVLYTSTWDHTTGTWSTPQTVPATPGMIEGLDLDVSAADEALLVWHGWDGQNDLFSTSRDLGTADPWAPPVRLTNNADGEWMASTTFDAAGLAVTVWANENATTAFGEGAEGIDVRPAANLAADSLSLSAFREVEGQEARLLVDVANIGLAAAAETTVEFYLGDPDGGGTPIGDPLDVPALLPGESASLVSDTFVLSTGTVEYYAVVTPDANETLVDDNSTHIAVESLPPDLAGPEAEVDLPAAGVVPAGTAVLMVTFNEPVVALSETHVSLVEDVLGTRPPEHVYLGADGMSAALIFEGGLPPGDYTLKILDSVIDLAGNPLDGDEDGTPGNDYVEGFSIVPALCWDGNGDAGWGDLDGGYSHWLDWEGNPTTEIPDSSIGAVVRGDTVAVAENREAGHLWLQSGKLTVSGDAALVLAGGLDVAAEAAYAVTLAGVGVGLIDAAGAAYLDGTLALEAVEPLGDLSAGEWGEEVRTILQADGGLGGTTFDTEPTPGDHLGHGVFYQGITYNDTSVDINLFQAAPGDLNGDHLFNFDDIFQMFLQSGAYYGNTAVTDQTWTTGDFTGDGAFTFDDIYQAFYSLGAHYGGGPYDTPPPVGPMAPVTLDEQALAASATDLGGVLALFEGRETAALPSAGPTVIGPLPLSANRTPSPRPATRGTAAHDAVLERSQHRETVARRANFGDLAWVADCQLRASPQRPLRRQDRPVAAVDRLLATWP